MTTQPHYLREWRKKRGLSQGALAEAIGVDRTLITKIETFKVRYNQDVLEGAARALGCTPADLLIRHPDDPHGLWTEYDLMTEAQRNQLAAVARTLRQTGS